MWIRQNPAIAHATVKHSRVAAAAADGVSATRPKLELVATFLWTGLGDREGRRH